MFGENERVKSLAPAASRPESLLKPARVALGLGVLLSVAVTATRTSLILLLLYCRGWEYSNQRHLGPSGLWSRYRSDSIRREREVHASVFFACAQDWLK